MIASTWVSMMACLPVLLWRYWRSVGVVHEEVFCEDCGAEGFAEDVGVFFPVRIVIGIVSSDALAWEVFNCGFVEAFC